MSRHNRIIITGGPGSGKSTLLEALQKEGFSCRKEVAREVIREYRKDDISPWNRREEFVRLVYERIFHDLHQPAAELTFYDRGLPDCIAYLREAGLPVPAEYLSFVPQLYYFGEAFILPPWEAVYRQDRERRQEFYQAVSLYNSIRKTYLDYGFRLVEIPKAPLQERVNFIKHYLIKAGKLEWERT